MNVSNIFWYEIVRYCFCVYDAIVIKRPLQKGRGMPCTILGPDTPMKDFRTYIRQHQHIDYYSKEFSETIHATAAFRNGSFVDQQEHLQAIADAQPDSRLASGLYYREMNPAQLLRILEDAGVSQNELMRASKRGEEAYRTAIADGLPASAACAKACAAIRRISWTYINSCSADDVASYSYRPAAA